MAEKTPTLAPDIDRLLTDREIAAALNVTRVQVFRMRKAGEMPPQVRVSERRAGTRASVFRQWQIERER